ncbi:MAG: isopentenyl phosphate kinase [Candidatus Aenigmatarchaeota archaeon]
MSLKVLKVGGSIITEKEKEEPSPDLEQMKRIASEINSSFSDLSGLVLVHGAGSYGHPIVKRTGIHEGLESEKDRVHFAETQRLQNELNSIFTDILIDNDVPAFPVQPSASAIMHGNLKEMNHEVVENLIQEDMVPVLYGVPAYDRKKGCSILSGDEILPYLAEKLGAKEVLHGTNVEGIYTSDPREDPDARIVRRISSLEEVREYLGGSKDTDVTGGMENKVRHILESEISGKIFDASEKGNVEKALRGEEVGTHISP